MAKMTLKVVLDSVRSQKDDTNKRYAEFFYTGGTASVLVDQEQFEKLKKLEGEEFDAVFSMRPRSVTLFGRAMTVFELSRLLELPGNCPPPGLPRYGDPAKK